MLDGDRGYRHHMIDSHFLVTADLILEDYPSLLIKEGPSTHAMTLALFTNSLSTSQSRLYGSFRTSLSAVAPYCKSTEQESGMA